MSDADEARVTRWVGLARGVVDATMGGLATWTQIVAPLMALADVEHAALTAEVEQLIRTNEDIRAEADIEDERACDVIRGLRATLGARNVTIERLTYDRNHPYGDVANVPDFVGADLVLDDDQDAVERLRQARRLAALRRQKP